MTIKKQIFGVLSTGEEVNIYTFSNDRISFSAIDYGCVITSILVPDRNGITADVTLGFPTMDGYVLNWGAFGAVIGRYAGRISRGEFKIGEKTYKLDINCPGNCCLHSGHDSFVRKLWNSKIINTAGETGVEFSRISPDGEQSFPGNLDIKIRYTIDKESTLTLKYEALTDMDTHINFTNHTYFDLSGQKHSGIKNHTLQLNSSLYLEQDENKLPTGNIISSVNTPFDFSLPKTIELGLKELNSGFDHCMVVRNNENIPDAKIADSETGRTLEIYSDKPGIQFYTPEFKNPFIGKWSYKGFCGLCLESQNFPDTPNIDTFPTTLIKAGEKYQSTTKWKFGIE